MTYETWFVLLIGGAVGALLVLCAWELDAAWQQRESVEASESVTETWPQRQDAAVRAAGQRITEINRRTREAIIAEAMRRAAANRDGRP